MPSNWGGKRENAGSGGKREGAGRPRTTWKTQGQSSWVVQVAKKDNGFMPESPQMWTLLGIDENGTLEFQTSDGDRS